MEALLVDLAQILGVTRVGLIWSGVLEQPVSVNGRGPIADRPLLPAAVIEPFVVVTDPDSANRRWVALDNAGYLWADLDAQAGWTETRTAMLRVAAELLSAGASVASENSVECRLHDAATLAGRLAHDLDNLWTGIVGFTDLARPFLKQGSTLEQYINEIAIVGQRGTELTQRLHQFSRTSGGRSEATAIGPVLERVLSRQPVPAVELAIPPDLPAVLIDSAALQTLLAELLANAQECGAKAAIAVSAGGRFLESSEGAGFHGNPGRGRYVEISVADHGPGVRPELLSRLLVEPFLTTKPRHRGLGLVIAHRIVRAHRGGIRIENSPGGGTTVRVLLPAAPDSPTGTEHCSLEATSHVG